MKIIEIPLSLRIQVNETDENTSEVVVRNSAAGEWHDMDLDSTPKESEPLLMAVICESIGQEKVPLLLIGYYLNGDWYDETSDQPLLRSKYKIKKWAYIYS